ncbi:ABSCISIC ACID-INSENSITIVE 5-like protein 2 isoform X2 [Canna indica]|uniref:ABSCISIC ACID-INSENSITIVE 5-like protein 2 isoform X2 n=1 Tax=Canna indica TaxID=4628 RepID=A0AAQ3KBJ0_9LILI|nr:ABSCISIC ACID-INSENSITIVE 5-like protein 2 isoform X2 [Canna indica]
MASSRVMASSSSANSDLTRQSSPCSLPVPDLQSSFSGGVFLSKGLGSMSMEDLFRNICGNNAGAFGDGGEGAASVSRQGSFAVPKSVGEKTVEEVWREITAGRNTDGESGPGAEMTLEDFLARAGAVGEEDVGVPSGSSQGGFRPNQMMGDQFGQPQPLAVENSVLGFGNGSEGAGKGGRGRKRAALDPVDRAALQRQKRMIKNRESAARSRERKQAYIAELESLVAQLEEENAQLLRSQVMLYSIHSNSRYLLMFICFVFNCLLAYTSHIKQNFLFGGFDSLDNFCCNCYLGSRCYNMVT